MQKLPEEEQEYIAKEVYKNGFSLELLKSIKEGKIIKEPTSKPALPSFPKQKEESVESLPSIIKRIKPSVVIVFAYDDKGEFLKLGSGFFISQNGDIITNYHVLQGASSAEVKTSDGKTYPIIYIVADDEQSDIIRLSVDIPSQYVYPLSLSITIPEVGERIIVYGSPLGLEKTVSDGIVSAIREVPDYGKVIQITAPVSPGSSGSPVLNMKGEVIGIATFQFIEGQNLNFAIPSEKISSLIFTEENKVSITEDVLGQESQVKKESDYDEAYQKALFFIDKEEYEKALPYLEIATKTNISSLKELAYYQIGRCNDELGYYIEAIESYKQSIRIDPNNPKNIAPYSLIGNDYYKLGLYKEAIEALKQSIRIDPYNVINSISYRLLGLAYHQLYLYKEAIKALKQSIYIDPNTTNTVTYITLGDSYMNLQLYDEAIVVFKQAIRIDSDLVLAHYGIGLCYLLIGDESSALNEYKILKELDIDLANELFDLIY